MQMDLKPFAHTIGLMNCSYKCHRFFNHDKIWKGVHDVICGSLVVVQFFRLEAMVLGAFLGVLGQMLGWIMPRMSRMFLKAKSKFEV